MTAADANDGGMLSQEALDAMLAEMGSDDPGLGMDGVMGGADSDLLAAAAPAPEVKAAPEPASTPSLSFVSFGDNGLVGADEGNAGFERVQDISLEIAVELGRTRLLIKDILDLTSGSIIELEKIAGEPVDLLANGLLIARGEVVVVEDSFGVRITQVITAAGRKEIATNTLHKAIT